MCTKRNRVRTRTKDRRFELNFGLSISRKVAGVAGAILLALGFMGGVSNSAYGYDPVAPNGNIVLTENDSFATGSVYNGSDFTNGTFTFSCDPVTDRFTFTNYGTVNAFTRVDAGAIGTFTNEGTMSDVKEIKGAFVNEGVLQLDTLNTIKAAELTLDSGSELYVRVHGDDTNDQYVVTGGTTVNGGEVVVNLDADQSLYESGNSFLFLKSGALSGSDTLTVSDKSTELDNRMRYNLYAAGSDYYIGLAKVQYGGDDAPTYNQWMFGGYIDTVDNGHVVNDSDLDNVLDKLDAMTPDGQWTPSREARYALEQMNGAVYGSMAMMEIQNMTIVNNQLANYLRPKDVFCRGEEACRPCAPVTNYWGMYYNVDGDVDPDGNAFGGDYSVNGVIAGGDRSITPWLRIGGFFAFGSTEYEVNGLDERADADSYKGGLYFVHSNERGYLFGNFNYGWADYEATRNITFLNRTNKGETSGDEWAFRIEKGFNYALSRAVVQPFAAFQYLSSSTDAFSETGEGATALDIGKSDFDSFRSEFGARILCGFEGEGRSGNAYIQASWLHEYGDTCGSVTGSFNNAGQQNYTGNYKYTVDGVDLGNDWCNLGIGGDLTMNDFTVFGGYDFMVSGSQSLHTGSAGMAYRY